MRMKLQYIGINKASGLIFELAWDKDKQNQTKRKLNNLIENVTLKIQKNQRLKWLSHMMQVNNWAMD